MNSVTRLKSFWNKFWRDKHGKVVIWQAPNAPLLVWLVTAVIGTFVKGETGRWIGFAGDLALAVWAFQEIRSGVNYFRRFLGIIVLIAVMANLLR
jgi:hypothetical protein